jgi:hypothetical protein
MKIRCLQDRIVPLSKMLLPILLFVANSAAIELNSSVIADMQAVSADSLHKHLTILGSDSLQGRGTGSLGGEMAAQYIAHQLEEMRLMPAGDHSSYFQSIPMHGSFPLEESRLDLYTNKGNRTFELGSDYLLFQSGAQTFIPSPVPVVFVGYGIIAPEYDYNDYQSLDVEGKVVAYLSGEPASNDNSYFEGDNPTIYSYPEAKRRIAISRGARGCILIPIHRDEREKSWGAWRNEFAFEDITLAYAATGNLSIVMNPVAAQRLFDGSPLILEKIFELDEKNGVYSFPLDCALSFHGKFKERDFIAHNVLAQIGGKDTQLKDTFLILTAHYDHLGIGPAVNGDSIYNGVLDNAIGVAGLLEIARAIAAIPDAPNRSILFLFVTGEEKGLLGSTYFLDHSPVPHYKMIANLNIDGLASTDTFSDLVGSGAELSSLGESLDRVACALGLRISDFPAQFLAQETFARSDQLAFARAGIPSILVSEGLSYDHIRREDALDLFLEWMREKYHTPFDDLSQTINYQAALLHARVLLAFARTLAEDQHAPQWKPGTPYINIRLQSIAERR